MRSTCSLLVLALLPSVPSAAVDFAGWVVGDPPSARPPSQSYAITRADITSTSTPPDRLNACDEVRLLDKQSRLNIALANGERVQLSADRTTFKVPCARVGVSSFFADALKALLSSNSPARTSTGLYTRGTELHVAGLGEHTAKLVAGHRAIYVTWRGGTPPFDVALHRFGFDKPLTERRGLRAQSTRLAPAALAPGRYVLTVVGVDGSGIEDSNIQVVNAEQLPRAPLAASDARLPDFERSLLWAYYLENFGDGTWSLEAVQAIAALPEETPIVRASLQRLEGR